MEMDETTKSKIERLIMVYAAHAKKAQKAHSDLTDLVWKYLDKQDPQSSLDYLEEMIYLIPNALFFRDHYLHAGILDLLKSSAREFHGTASSPH